MHSSRIVSISSCSLSDQSCGDLSREHCANGSSKQSSQRSPSDSLRKRVNHPRKTSQQSRVETNQRAWRFGSGGMIFLIYSFSFLFFFFYSWFGLKRQAAFVLCIPKTARSLATIAPHDRLFFFLIPLAVEHPKNGYHFRDTMRSATAKGFSPKPPVASRTKTCSRAWILP